MSEEKATPEEKAKEEEKKAPEEKEKFWGKRLIKLEEVKKKLGPEVPEEERILPPDFIAMLGAAAEDGDDAALRLLKGYCTKDGYSVACMALNVLKKALVKKGIELPEELKQDYWAKQREAVSE